MSTSVTQSPCHSQWRGEGWSSVFTPSPHHTPTHTSSLWGRAAMKCSADRIITLTRKWIEECTGCVSGSKGFREYLQDGTVLCKLVLSIQPGLIRKINYLKSPFAWRENLSFFCEACLGLGLRSSQLFNPEDLLVSGPTTHSPYRPRLSSQDEDKRKLQSVALTVFWLGSRVAELPDYSGPLLSTPDLDSTTTKSPSLTLSSREQSLTPSESTTSTAAALDTPSHAPSHAHPPQGDTEVSHSVEQPTPPATVTETVQQDAAADIDSRSEKSKSPVPLHSRKVSAVASLVAETSDTRTQSFPQVVRFPQHTTNSPKHTKKIPIRHTKSEPETPSDSLLKVPNASRAKGHNRQLSDSHTIVTTDIIVQEEFEKSRSPEVVHISEAASSLGLVATSYTVFESSPQNSQETFEELRELVNSATPSEASTVVLREHLSRCSTRSTTGKSECSETESTLNSPFSAARQAEDTETEQSGKTVPGSSQSGDLEFVQSLVTSPLELSNPEYASEATPVDHTGLISLEFCQEINSNSQETASVSLYSPEAPFHFNLTQTSQDPAASDLEASVLSPEPLPSTRSEKASSSLQSGDRKHSDSAAPNPEALGHIREESSGFDLPSPVVYRVPLKGRKRSTEGGLATSFETFPIDSLTSVVASKSLKEVSVQSRHSSLSSVNSSNCSYIVVSYSTGGAHQENNVAEIGTASDIAAYANNIDCYYSDASDENIESSTMEVSVLNNQNSNFGRSSVISAAVPCEGHNHKSASNEFHRNKQNDSGKLTLYSSSPLSASSAVPHHSLSVATSGPDSPSSYQAVEGRGGGQGELLLPTAGSGWQELTVAVVRLPGEKQLGVSLSGGREEGTCPRIDAITGDSPAARSALQCSDELLTVNGVPLHATNRSEATTMLNEAASKDKIIFRVRRPLESHHHHSPYSKPAAHLLPLSLLRNIQPVGDLTRVQSDALPSSMHASKVLCDLPPHSDRELHADAPDFLSDANSMAVEIGSSLDDDLERVSMSDSHMDIQMEEGGDLGNNGMEDKLMHFVLLTKGERGKEGRPYSAPSRSVSTGAVPLGTSYTLPPNISGAEITRMKEKRTSLSEEREKRKANIAESARAAQKFRTKRTSVKSDSLSRDYRSASLSSKSGCSDEEFFQQHSAKHIRKSSSPAVIARALHHQDDPVRNPSSSPLNLRNMSIDDTKEASFSQMAEIWRQVEEADSSEGGADTQLPKGDQTDSTTHTSEVDRAGSPEDKGQIENVKPILADEVEDEIEDAKTEEDAYEAAMSEGSPTHSHDGTEESARPRSEVLQPADIELSLDDSSPTHKATPTVNGSVHNGATLAPPTVEDRRTRAPSFSNKDIDSLLSTLRSLSVRGEEEEELKVLENMLKSNTFKKAKLVHDSMHSVLLDDSSAIRPVIRRIVPISQLMRQHLHHHTEPSPEVNELRELIRKPHVQAVLFTHDKVSSRDLYVPDRHFPKAAQDPVDIILSASIYNFQAMGNPIDTSAPLSREVPSCRKEDATIVFLERTNRPLGCTIYKQDDSVFIGKLLKGCDAEQNEVLREGDELLEVNGVPVMQRSTDEIVRLMSGGQPGTTLAFTIIPVHDDNVDVLYEPKYVRAHFNYNGRCDEEIPCKALGLSFSKGDILEISNQDDPHWWQARKVFDDGGESLPGLIPARHLQQQREAMIRSYPFSSAIERKKGFMSIFSKKKKKKIFYQNTPPSNVLGVGDEVVTYEDVAKLESEPDNMRPIILIGAPGVGRRTLLRKLFKHDSSHYAPVVQHTTRGIRPGEVHGHDYYFVSREEFERDVENDRFLEYGELRGHYYGLAFSSIKKVMESGQVPVLDLHPQALKKIRHSGLKPYIIFIASPRMERLQITRRVSSHKAKRKSSSTGAHMDDMQVYTESDLHHLMEESYLIENQYGHYFDWIIVNDDFQVAADMLKEVSRRLEEEPQWVPVSWTLEQF